MRCVRPDLSIPVIDQAVLTSARAKQVLARDDPGMWAVVPGASTTVELLRACRGRPIPVDDQNTEAATGGDNPVKRLLHHRQSVTIIRIVIGLLDHAEAFGNSAPTLQSWEAWP